MRSKSHKIEDRILLKRAIGEACPEALGEIYQRHKPFVSKYIAKRVHCQGDNQDLVHTVFLRLCQGNCKYSGDSDVQGYLCGIAKNVLRDYFKAKGRQIKGVSLDAIEISGDLLITHCHTEKPSENLQKQEFHLILKKVVANLPDKSRQAVELVCFEGLRPIDACRKAGCSFEAFRSRLNLGRKLLQRELKDPLKTLSYNGLRNQELWKY